VIIPSAFDPVWFLVTHPLAILTVTALGSLVRSDEDTGLPAIFWLLVIMLVPGLGALGWFVLKRTIRVMRPTTREPVVARPTGTAVGSQRHDRTHGSRGGTPRPGY